MAFANLIDGRAIAEQINAETLARVAALKGKGIQPGLTFVRVGDDPAPVRFRDFLFSFGYSRTYCIVGGNQPGTCTELPYRRAIRR